MKPPLNIPQVSEQIGAVLQVIGHPARVAILLAIGHGEACVCHLESILGWRQAYISQNLMALRKADVLQDRRDGRYIYYRLKNEALLTLVRDTARLSGIDPETVDALTNPSPVPNCECPHCAPEPITAQAAHDH